MAAVRRGVVWRRKRKRKKRFRFFALAIKVSVRAWIFLLLSRGEFEDCVTG